MKSWITTFYPNKFVPYTLFEIYMYILKVKCHASSVFPGPHESGLIISLGNRKVYIFKPGELR